MWATYPVSNHVMHLWTNPFVIVHTYMVIIWHHTTDYISRLRSFQGYISRLYYITFQLLITFQGSIAHLNVEFSQTHIQKWDSFPTCQYIINMSMCTSYHVLCNLTTSYFWSNIIFCAFWAHYHYALRLSQEMMRNSHNWKDVVYKLCSKLRIVERQISYDNVPRYCSIFRVINLCIQMRFSSSFNKSKYQGCVLYPIVGEENLGQFLLWQ